jgi:hypothetical protein
MTARSMLADEAAFLAAEQNLAELRRQINAAAERVSSVEEEKALVGPLEKRMWEFYRVILLSRRCRPKAPASSFGCWPIPASG